MDSRHTPPGRAFLSLVLALALAATLSACGGGETTVTVTETVTAPSGADGGGKQSGSGDITLESGAVAGYVDHLREESGSLILTGWAAAGDRSQPAALVIAQVGGRTVAEAVPAIEREDVVEALGEPGLSESGFELRLPLDSLDCGAPAAGVRVIGSLDGRSSLVPYGEGIKEAVTDVC